MGNSNIGFSKVKGLRGNRGLLAAIIAQATSDLKRPNYRDSAIEYFNSEWYRLHLEYLGLHPELMPLEY